MKRTGAAAAPDTWLVLCFKFVLRFAFWIHGGCRLFELGFAEQLSAIMHQMSGSRQTMLFSATLPRALAEFARAGLREPELVRLDSDTKISPDLQLAFFTARFAWMLQCAAGDMFDAGRLLHTMLLP